MSGFLVNLLARSRGTADVLQPRIASLFEPPETSLPNAEWSADPESESDAASLPDGTETAARAPRETSGPHVHASMPLRQRTVERDTDLDEVIETSLSPGVSAGRGAPVSEPATRPRPQEPATMRAAEAAGATATTRVDRHVDDIGADGPPATAPGRPVERTGPDRRAPSRPEMPPQAPSLRSNAAANHQSLALRPSATGILSPPPRRPRFEVAPQGPAAVSSEPAVQVTIGRIEIRAVTDPAPPRKERAESPVMSLEDYLRSRARGDRR